MHWHIVWDGSWTWPVSQHWIVGAGCRVTLVLRAVRVHEWWMVHLCLRMRGGYGQGAVRLPLIMRGDCCAVPLLNYGSEFVFS